MKKNIHDVIVIGAGHAGIEAAHAAAKLGCSVLFLTLSVDTIGKLSCNPAIGGVAKSHLVREVDALGGLMARFTDKASLQFRTLNASKGKAVWATRVQIDKFQYNENAVETILATDNIEVFEAEVEDLIVKNNKIAGVVTNMGDFYSKKVVITAGTFLDAKIHVGLKNFYQGRLGELSSRTLFQSIKDLGIETKHFKTGTCARLDKRTIDFSCMEEQKPDPAKTFSFFTDFKPYNKESCFVTYTNPKTHKIIMKGMKYSPLYTGVIQATGVRYCPSIEDKLMRFGDRDRHHVFVEPEGKDTVEIYANGISTSLPLEIQYDFIRSIKGFENVKIIRPGYGIEHGVIEVRELAHTLEHKKIKGLYFAGQVNGTTGYEEAAAQGIVAGINAALAVHKKEPFILHREESFIGMLIDELTFKGTNEPYRVFTSRSEFRLLLREDNAIYRLYKKAYNLGMLNKEEYTKVKDKEQRIHDELKRLNTVKFKPADINTKLKRLKTAAIDQGTDAYTLLKRPEVTYKHLNNFGLVEPLTDKDEIDQIEIAIKYEGFIRREKQNAKSLQDLDKIKVPSKIDYKKIPGLSTEIQEKLQDKKPTTLREAQEISGMTPAALVILMGYIRNKSKSRTKKGG